MAVTFVLGRAGVGKTRYCIDALLRALDDPHDDRPIILLVPEQASFQMERALATRAAGGGFCRAEVLSFTRLAQRILAEWGGPPPALSRAARAMALRCAARRAGPALRFYRDAAGTPGFYHHLGAVIEELLRERVTPHQLRDAARGLADGTTKRKLAELARLYQEYLDWLGPQRSDPAARLELTRARIAAVPWLRDAAIWVDGFAGFTEQELVTLVALARSARELTLTLLLDPAAPAVAQREYRGDPLRLFHRTETTYRRLRRLLDEAGVAVERVVALTPATPPRFRAVPALAHMEAGLAAPIDVPLEGAEAVSVAGALEVRECATHRDELREAARCIRQKIIDSRGALHYRDFALIARDLEPFARLVAEVFAEYEIPYFLDRRRPLGAHPLARLTEALFEVVVSRFSLAAMRRLLRTGLLPLSPAQTEELENLMVLGAVEGPEMWDRPTWRFARELADALTREDGSRRAAPAPPADLDAARRRLVEALAPLRSAAQADPPPGARLWAGLLSDVFERLGVRERMTGWIAASRAAGAWERAETHRLAWEAWCAALTELHDVLGELALRAEEVAAVLAGALREQTLGLAPPTLDQVLVSEIERSRHPDIRYAWVFGFNEGRFPPRPADAPLLSPAERAALHAAGLPASLVRQDDAFAERLLMYIAFTRPSHGLTISFARVGDDGEPLFPSPLLSELARVFPSLQPRSGPPNPPPASLPELARGYLRARRELDAGQSRLRYERLRGAVEAAGDPPAPAGPHAATSTAPRAADRRAEALRWLLRGLDYRNAPQRVDNQPSTVQAGVLWAGSPSEIETYLLCPFKHLARFGLRLDPAGGPQPLGWDLGAAAHKLLAEVTELAMREPAGIRGLSDERWQELLERVFRKFERDWPADLLTRRPDLVFQLRRLHAFVGEVVAVHAERWHRGVFEPLACEQVFGRGSASGWPALSCAATDGRQVLLRGKIDRVDHARDGERTLLVVYDYKSGKPPSAATYLCGAWLQLFCYLLAVRQARGGPRTTVAGVFLAPLYPNAESLETTYVATAPPLEQRMYLYRPRGLFVREIARLLDPALGQTASPVAAMKLRKDGEFDARQSRDVVSADDLEQRLDLARRTILLAAEGIAAGQVAVAPLLENRKLACKSCEYLPVCRFDRALNTPRRAEVDLPALVVAEGPAEEAAS